jgi:integrase
MMRGFLKWYGKPIDDLKVKVPRSLPSYTDNEVIEKLKAAVSDKRSHKGTIERDILLIDMALNTGMRRGELANLQTKEIHADFLVVRQGKNKKDRVMPLNPDIVSRLHNFVKNKQPEEKVFGLNGPSLTMLIKKPREEPV